VSYLHLCICTQITALELNKLLHFKCQILFHSVTECVNVEILLVIAEYLVFLLLNVTVYYKVYIANGSVTSNDTFLFQNIFYSVVTADCCQAG